jgi:hypothetical protein
MLIKHFSTSFRQKNVFIPTDDNYAIPKQQKKVLGFTSTLIVMSVAMNANPKLGNFLVFKLIMLPSHVLISVNVELCVACGLCNRFV